MEVTSRRFTGWCRNPALTQSLSAALALALATLVALGGCDSRRAQKTRLARQARNEEPVTPPPPVEAPRQVPPPRQPEPPPPAPRTRPAPKDDRLGACGPGKGARLNVQGVDEADTLNVRAAPDAQSEVLGQLSPHATGVLSLGDRRKVGAAMWHKVKCGPVTGWANEKFLSGAASR
jgi:hypothetical protein